MEYGTSTFIKLLAKGSAPNTTTNNTPLTRFELYIGQAEMALSGL